MKTISRTQNSVVMAQARAALKGQWGLAVGVTFVYMLILVMTGVTPDHYIFLYGNIKFGVIHVFLSLLISGPLGFGVMVFGLAIARSQDADIAQLFKGFRRYGTVLAASWLQALYCLLWSLLLIIPGIIAAYSYSQIFFILADDESISASAALKKSALMMKGNKWKRFCLDLRFIGWGLLCIPTLGIGGFWLLPYMDVSWAEFYQDLLASGAQTTFE